jgi:hypothetical protein
MDRKIIPFSAQLDDQIDDAGDACDGCSKKSRPTFQIVHEYFWRPLDKRMSN